MGKVARLTDIRIETKQGLLINLKVGRWGGGGWGLSFPIREMAMSRPAPLASPGDFKITGTWH